jgi:hypothetical protein
MTTSKYPYELYELGAEWCDGNIYTACDDSYDPADDQYADDLRDYLSTVRAAYWQIEGDRYRDARGHIYTATAPEGDGFAGLWKLQEVVGAGEYYTPNRPEGQPQGGGSERGRHGI